MTVNIKQIEYNQDKAYVLECKGELKEAFDAVLTELCMGVTGRIVTTQASPGQFKAQIVNDCLINGATVTDSFPVYAVIRKNGEGAFERHSVAILEGVGDTEENAQKNLLLQLRNPRTSFKQAGKVCEHDNVCLALGGYGGDGVNCMPPISKPNVLVCITGGAFTKA